MEGTEGVLEVYEQAVGRRRESAGVQSPQSMRSSLSDRLVLLWRWWQQQTLSFDFLKTKQPQTGVYTSFAKLAKIK